MKPNSIHFSFLNYYIIQKIYFSTLLSLSLSLYIYIRAVNSWRPKDSPSLSVSIFFSSSSSFAFEHICLQNLPRQAQTSTTTTFEALSAIMQAPFVLKSFKTICNQLHDFRRPQKLSFSFRFVSNCFILVNISSVVRENSISVSTPDFFFFFLSFLFF